MHQRQAAKPPPRPGAEALPGKGESMGIMVFLESAIGVVFAFLVVSIFVTAVNELIAERLKLRAKQLEAGIMRMLGGDAEMTARLFSHPLVLLSSRSMAKGPSYIKKEDFSEVLLDLISSKGSLDALGGAYKATFDLAKAVSEAPFPEEIKKLISSFSEAAKADVSAFKAKAEAWFDSSMERVSGWYNRKIRWISFFIGLAIACAANVDTIALASRMAVDQDSRAKIVSQALDYVNKGQVQQASDESARIKLIVDGDLARLQKDGIVGWGSGTRLFLFDGGASWILAINIFFKILGLLITAAAVSLGAPFWFDLLGKLANVRTSLQPGAGEEKKE
jgi:hypothetical protein